VNLINIKNFEQLVKSTDEKLTIVGLDTGYTSVSRLFANVINQEINSFYETLNINHLNCFLSTATDESVDAIGVLLDCERKLNEADIDYKKRISEQIRVVASSNELSIHNAARDVSGVFDIIVKPYAYGIGSFSVIVIPMTGYTSETVVNSVRSAISNVVAYGCKYEVSAPEEKKIKINITLEMKNNLSLNESQSITFTVQDEIRKYISNLTIGESFNIDKLTQIILAVDKQIIHYHIVSLQINKAYVLPTSQYCKYYERFVLDTDNDTILVN
jgi:hypothetical protein